MPGSVGAAMSGPVVSGGPMKKKYVKDLLRPDKKATKKFAQRRK